MQQRERARADELRAGAGEEDTVLSVDADAVPMCVGELGGRVGTQPTIAQINAAFAFGPIRDVPALSASASEGR